MKVSSKEVLPFMEERCAWEYLSKLDVHKSMGPDGVFLQVLRELANVIGRPLPIIFERS